MAIEIEAFGRKQRVDQHLEDLMRMLPPDSSMWQVLNAALSTIRVNESFLRAYEKEEAARRADALGPDSRASFRSIWERVAQRENLVPVEHPRMGGIWSMDRWLFNGVEARLMDDGWTQEIRAPDVVVRVDGNDPNPVFTQGDGAMLAQVARGLV